jgi:hypothetical protein
VERLLEELSRWGALERAGESAAGRLREEWLRRQAAEEATWAGLVADLAERRAEVTVQLAGGRARRGRLLAFGLDFLLLAGPDISRSSVPVMVALSAVTALRHEAGDAQPGPSEPRPGPEPATLAQLLGRLAPGRPRLRVALAGGETLTGDLDSVGEDMMAIRAAAPEPRVTYLRLAAVVDVSLLGSG